MIHRQLSSIHKASANEIGPIINEKTLDYQNEIKQETHNVDDSGVHNIENESNINKKEYKKYSTKDILKATGEYFGGDQLAADVWMNKYALKDSDGNIYELTPDDMHHRIASEIARIEKHYPNPLSEKEIYEVLKNNLGINSSIRKTLMENFDLIPSKLLLSNLDSNDFNIDNPLLAFKNSLQNLDKLYDFVILDCPSSMSFLTLNCLAAADSVLVPVQCEPFALDATTQILTKIINVQTTLNPNLGIEGFLLTMYDSKTSLCVEIANEIRQLFKENTFLTPIPRTVSIPESNRKGLPVCLFRPTSSATIAFFSLAREIIDKENI